MSVVSPQAITTIVAVPHSFACATTCARLIVQCLNGRLWWDDFWAGFAQIWAIVLWAVSMQLPMGGAYSRPLQILSIIGMLLFYTAALWAAKLSVAVTIVKLLAPGSFRTFAKVAATFFALMWIGLSTQRLFACGINFEVRPFCRLPVYTGYLELGTDLASDFWLIGAPLTMLWKIKLSTYHRRLIGGAFVCGIATTIASIVHIYFIIVKDDILTGLSGHVQVGVSLVVCNILTLTTYVYRRLHQMGNASERTSTPDLSPADDDDSDANHSSPLRTPPTANQIGTRTSDIKLTEFDTFSTFHHRPFDEEYTRNVYSSNEEYTQNIHSYGTGGAVESGMRTTSDTHVSFPTSSPSENYNPTNRTPRSSLSITK